MKIETENNTILFARGNNDIVVIKRNTEGQTVKDEHWYVGGGMNGWPYARMVKDEQLTESDLRGLVDYLL